MLEASPAQDGVWTLVPTVVGPGQEVMDEGCAALGAVLIVDDSIVVGICVLLVYIPAAT